MEKGIPFPEKHSRFFCCFTSSISPLSKERNYFFSQIACPLLHTLSKGTAEFSRYQPLSSSTELVQPPQLFASSAQFRQSPKTNTQCAAARPCRTPLAPASSPFLLVPPRQSWRELSKVPRKSKP